MSNKIVIEWTVTMDYQARVSRQDVEEFLDEDGVLDVSALGFDSWLAELESEDVELDEGSHAGPGCQFERAIDTVEGIRTC